MKKSAELESISLKISKMTDSELCVYIYNKNLSMDKMRAKSNYWKRAYLNLKNPPKSDNKVFNNRVWWKKVLQRLVLCIGMPFIFLAGAFSGGVDKLISINKKFW